jgi:hypothetical protein
MTTRARAGGAFAELARGAGESFELGALSTPILVASARVPGESPLATRPPPRRPPRSGRVAVAVADPPANDDLAHAPTAEDATRVEI